MSDDKTIAAMIADRQETGMELLISKYSTYAKKVASRFFDSPQDTEECINDAMLDVWNTKDIGEIKNLKAFVAVCVRRRATDMLRSTNAQKRSRNMTAILAELEDICDTQTTESEFERRETGRIIEDFARSLRPPDKDIFLLRYFYGMEIKEIARRLMLTRSSVDNRLFKCRKNLKKMLEENI